MTMARSLAKRSDVFFSNGVMSSSVWSMPDTAAVDATESNVYGLTAWYRAVALISGTIAALPFKVYRNDTRELVRTANVVKSPNNFQTPFEFWQIMVAHCLTHGNAYALKSKNGAGVVTEVRAVHPSKVRVVSGKKTELNPEGRWFIVRSNDGESTYSPSEMFELPYLAIDGSVGVSPLAVARRSLGIGLSAEQTSSQFYRRGARPLGFLKSKKSLTDENATRLQSRFESRTSGADNAGKVVVLDNDTEWQGISMPPIDAQLLESRKFTATEIARLFGIPPHLLGDVEKSSSWGTGIEQQMTGFVQFSLLPWLTLIQQRVTRDLLPGGWTAGSWYAEFVVEGLLRGDSAARAQFYASGITNGWFSRNEARSRENLDPREGLDELLVPSNLTLVSVDGSLVPLSSTGVNAQQP